MRDGYGRVIDYLRISVTDRCNFRCRYCMPAKGVDLLEAAEILSYEELLRVITILGKHGVNKIRLTGGEPLVRKGMVDFIRSIRAIGTVTDLAMTTNGSLLGDVAHQLKRAGLDRVNISIDTINPKKFTHITGGKGIVEEVLQGIESGIEAGLTPIKLNVVVTEVLSEEDVFYFIDRVHKIPIAVRFIEYMPVGHCGVRPGSSIADIKTMINKAGRGNLESAKATRGNGPATYYRLPEALGLFGFITPMTDHFCQDCNRMRLTADGKIKPCLLANYEIDSKMVLRGGVSDNEVYEIFLKALQAKPIRHRLSDTREGEELTRGMFQVGG
ncbi:MAG: GTP 3',8-cyclase MoaA [Sporomusaceae bacterium]|nr:GTP 3',8-cyclase MoaA [Sporomusaceae bacterium]